MSTLKFIYGPVSTGKTVELLVQTHQIKKIHGKDTVKLMKPDFDTREGVECIKSACGLVERADFIVGKTDCITDLDIEPSTYLLVDEIQFFTIDQIFELRKLSLEKDVVIECYGLLKDFRNDIFLSSAKLIELADECREFKTFCYLCSKKKLSKKQANANFNMKIVKNEGGKISPTLDGESCEVGGIEMFVPTCSKCYFCAFKEIEMTSFVLSQMD